MREATLASMPILISDDISIPASHAGGDETYGYDAFKYGKFQSPPPMREATGLSDEASSDE